MKFYRLLMIVGYLPRIELQNFRVSGDRGGIQLANAELPNAELPDAELLNAELPNAELLNAGSYRTPNY